MAATLHVRVCSHCYYHSLRFMMTLGIFRFLLSEDEAMEDSIEDAEDEFQDVFGFFFHNDY